MCDKLRSSTVIGLVLCTVMACADMARGADDKATEGKRKPAPTKAKILFLHHSTGECVWNGGVPAWFDAYNNTYKTTCAITEQNFPQSDPYGWENYPYDFWNIWVRHAGKRPYKNEPTLEMLTAKYDMIVFKHCFPVSAVEPDIGRAAVASADKRLENYKLQYAALKKKLREFPQTKFILWTSAALVKSETDAAAAGRSCNFVDWVRNTWDQRGDNIFLWDFHRLETDGGLYLKNEYASGDSHPNETFSKQVAPLFCRRVVDVIRGVGDSTSITGKSGKEKAARKGAKPVPVAPEPTPKAPRRVAKPGRDAWVFDDAEDPKRERRLWTEAAAYVKDGEGHAIRVSFAKGEEEDWGEYGRQRIVTTAMPEKNHDLEPYRYVAFRVKADRSLEVVFTIVTRPDSLTRTDVSYFGFSAYRHAEADAWKWIVLDLAKLELGTEGDRAYNTAGKPARPMKLTSLKFVTNKKNEAARVLIDDIVFYRTLPKALADKLHSP